MSEPTTAIANDRKPLTRHVRFLQERRAWTTPDLVINPIGTLILWEKGKWILAPWSNEFMRELRERFFTQEDLRVMISIPAKMKEAQAWDLILLTSGLSEYFGRKGYLWPKEPPISGTVATDRTGYPKGVFPVVYIDCIPARMVRTFQEDTPEKSIYWRPSEDSIAGMKSYNVGWEDCEDRLIDYADVVFAGSPEDVISALEIG